MEREISDADHQQQFDQVNQLYREEKTKNANLTAELQELRIDSKKNNKLFRQLLKTAHEEKQKADKVNLERIKELTEEVERLKKSAKVEPQVKEQIFNQEDQRKVDGKRVKKFNQPKPQEEDQSLLQLYKDRLAECEDGYIRSFARIDKLQLLLEEKEMQLQEKQQQNSQLNQLLKELENKAQPNPLDKNKENEGKKPSLQFDIQLPQIDSAVIHYYEDLKTLYDMLIVGARKPIGFKLLFRASRYDFDIRYKYKYLNVPNTVLLVKTQHSRIIGGFSRLPWKDTSSQNRGQAQCDFLGQSFIFSITLGHKLVPEHPSKYWAIEHHNNYGPIFWSGICIADQSNDINKSSALYYNALRYNHPEYEASDKVSWMNFIGSAESSQFYVKEWEVHQVLFNK